MRTQRDRRGTLARLAAAFALVAFFAQTFQPWYLCWALPFAGAVLGWRRTIQALAAFGLAEVLVTAPNGHGLEDRLVAFPAFAAAAVIVWLVLRSGPLPLHSDHPVERDADDARAGVRADGGPDLRGDHATD